MTMSDVSTRGDAIPGWAWKLWIYTNYDCNIQCAYCLARSSPSEPRRALGAQTAIRLVDEAVALGFEDIFFTGGEPFLLHDIYDMLAHASARVRTTVLTNAMIIRGRRLDKLAAIAHPNLTIQVSLDGGCAEHHDAWRGQGTWDKTVAGIRLLQARGLRVRLSTTETPANAAHLDQVCEFHRSLDIAEDDHVIRQLARRGLSEQGLEVTKDTLLPELTVNRDGVFWHPISTDADMLVTDQIFPLARAVACAQEHLAQLGRAEAGPAKTVR
jgi:MoaA/NifB/PqqE/SkfB family radical SAM enzyme